MPRLVRLSLVAVLSTGLLLTLSALSSAVPAPGAAATPADPAAERAREVLDDVVAAFSSHPAARPSRPSRPTPDEHGRDMTLLLRDLGVALPALTGEDRRSAEAFLARPTDQPAGDGSICAGCQPVVLGGTVETSATEHFLVHYQTARPLVCIPPTCRDQVTTPTQLASTKAVLEEVWDKEIGTLGFRKPLGDQNETSFGTDGNPDAKIDVFLADVGYDGIYGYVSSDDFSERQVAPYIVLDDDFDEFQLGPQHSLKVTVAHEFFHAIQFAYDAGESAWFTEGTAVWIEDIVYPTINDYLQYIQFSQAARPLQPVNTTGGLERYGAVTFWKYLTEGYYSNSLIRSIWTAADFPRSKNGLTATKDVLKARGYSWVPAFARSAIWATLPAGTYADRNGMIQALKDDGLAPGNWAKVTLGKTAGDTGAARVSVDHLSTAPLVVSPGSSLPTQARLQVIVNAPDTALGSAARVQLRLKSGKVKYFTVALSRTGYGTKTIGFNRTQVASAIVTLTNASLSIDNQPFTVRARIVY